MKKGKLFIVSAPSGAGKTSLTNHVVQNLQSRYPISKIITYTTRLPRPGEHQGVDYHFVSLAEFEQKKAAGAFLETTEYSGNWYASPRSIIDDLAKGKSFFLVVDRPGAKNLKTLVEDPTLIWLTVPDEHTIEQRLATRATDNDATQAERLALAKKELHDEERDPAFTYHIVNNDFEAAAQEIMAIIKRELA